MAQIASLASVSGAGASIYGQVQQKQDAEKRQKEQQRQQAAQQAAQLAERQAQVEVRNAATVEDEAARAEQLRLADAASRTQRDATLKRTIAQARARLAAGGLDPSVGSAQALVCADGASRAKMAVLVGVLAELGIIERVAAPGLMAQVEAPILDSNGRQAGRLQVTL